MPLMARPMFANRAACERITGGPFGPAQARPLLRIKDFAGASATYEYAVDAATFADWVDEASFIRSLEYPAGEKEPVYIDPDDYRIGQISSTGKKLPPP